MPVLSSPPSARPPLRTGRVLVVSVIKRDFTFIKFGEKYSSLFILECDINPNNKINIGNNDNDYDDNYNGPTERPPRPRPSRPGPSSKRPVSQGRRPTTPPRPENRFRDSDYDQVSSERPSGKEQRKKPQYPSYVRVEQLDESATSPPIDKTSKYYVIFAKYIFLVYRFLFRRNRRYNRPLLLYLLFLQIYVSD